MLPAQGSDTLAGKLFSGRPGGSCQNAGCHQYCNRRSDLRRAGSAERGQSSAALALGMTHWQSMKLIILPQAFRAMVPLLLTQGIVLFQDTSLVYVLSLADFFRTASTIGERDGTQVEMILFAGFVYFVISLSASLLVSYLKKRTV